MKVLLVQTSFLGDNILSTPVLAGIKSICEPCSIDVVTTKIAASVYEGNPLVRKVLVFDKRDAYRGVTGLFRFAKLLRQEKYDRVYSLHRSARTSCLLWLSGIAERIGFATATLSFLYSVRKQRPNALHEVDRNLALLAPEFMPGEESKALHLPVVKSGAEVVKDLAQISVTSYAVLVPGSVWATKRWATEEFRKTAEQLIAQGKQVVLLGAPNEVAIAEQVAAELPVVNLTGQTSLPEMFSVVSDASVVVCNDSMSLHVASSFKVPTVVVFCATSPTFGFGPWQNDRARIVEKSGLDCKPCRRHGGNQCPTGTNACMEQVPAAQVLSKIEEVAAW